MADFDALVAMADRDVQKHLGGPITYTPGVGAPVSIRGVFEALHVSEDLGQAGVSAAGPAVFLTLADLPSNPLTDEGLRVTVKGVIYKPRDVQPDGLGGVLILLHLA